MNTAPTIVIGLADPNDMSQILPLPADSKVSPDSRGRVRFRARVDDAEANLTGATMQCPNASATANASPSSWLTIGVSWDVTKVKDGAQAAVVVTAHDAEKEIARKETTVTLRRK